MKNFLLIVLFVIGSVSVFGANNSIYFSEVKMEQGRRRHCPKNNVNPKDLPASIIQYVEKNYPDYSIILSKRNGDGYYYLKINDGKDRCNSRYRSLVFDNKGKVVSE